MQEQKSSLEWFVISAISCADFKIEFNTILRFLFLMTLSFSKLECVILK